MAEGATDPRTVLVTDSHKVAQTVVEWLASVGIAAEVTLPRLASNVDPIAGLTDLSPDQEMEVRVLDAQKVAEAMTLLSDAQRTAQLHAIREQRAQRTGTVTATCEDCGKPSDWPATAMGKTETCPHCTAYMDIPDPDDDWSGVDFGNEEEEEKA